MSSENIPLINFFYKIRLYGFNLGIDDYLLLIDSIRAGFGIRDQKDLEQLCFTLWAKSPEDQEIIHKLLTLEVFKVNNLSRAINTIPLENNTDSESKNVYIQKPNNSEKQSNEAKNNEVNEIGFDNQVTEKEKTSGEPDPLEQYKELEFAETEKIYHSWNSFRSQDYFPISRRQMKQIWRNLKKKIRYGVPNEVDIEKTIDKAARDSFFLSPVLVPERTNVSKVLFLLDRDGSMVPFHILSDILVETCRSEALLYKPEKLYFHDYPNHYMYKDQSRLEPVLLRDFWNYSLKDVNVIIFSDAGASRGSLDKERTKNTIEFTTKLQQNTKHCIWLNPMPKSRWRNSSAYEISQSIFMSEFSLLELRRATTYLKGKFSNFINISQRI